MHKQTEKIQFDSSTVQQIKCFSKKLIIKQSNCSVSQDSKQLTIGSVANARYLKTIQQCDLFVTFFTGNIFSRLLNVYIIDFKLQNLQKMHAPLLQKLMLTTTNIKYLDQFATENYPSLKQIQITSGSLRLLPKFNTPKLEKLNIIGNQYCLEIQEFCKGNYPELKEIQLFQCNIEKLFQLSHCPKLQSINIDSRNQNGKIAQVSEFAKGHYPGLKTIKAFSNIIQKLSSLSKNQNIQGLYFRNNCIRTLQYSFNDSYSKLKFIDLSGNKIQIFPQCFQVLKYPCLQVLNLNSNQIRLLPQINADNIVSINVNENKIQSIQGFSKRKYQKLVKFEINQNHLTLILLIKAPKLQIFSLKSNRIRKQSYPDQECFKNTTLKAITYRKQIIKKDQIMNYENLQTFQCSQNQLQRIPKFLTLNNFTKLSSLTLNNNKINNIELLSDIDLKLVKNLILHSNQIVSFKIFQKIHIPNIYRINLNHNKTSQRRRQLTRLKFNNHQSQSMIIDENSQNFCQNLYYLVKQRLQINIIFVNKFSQNECFKSLKTLKQRLKKCPQLNKNPSVFISVQTYNKNL